MIIYLCIRIFHYEYTFEMFLTIQMHLTCRKDRIQANKDETCSQEQVMTFQNERKKKYDECSDIIDA